MKLTSCMISCTAFVFEKDHLSIFLPEFSVLTSDTLLGVMGIKLLNNSMALHTIRSPLAVDRSCYTDDNLTGVRDKVR